MSRVWKIILGVVALVFLSCFLSMGQSWIIEVLVLVPLGWISFLRTVIPEVQPQWGAIAEALAVVVVLGVGLHLFLRGLWRQLQGEAAQERPWPVRWSVSLLALLVLLFCATMATVGLAHNVGWLFTSREPLTKSSWFYSSYIMNTDNARLCDHALRLSKDGQVPPGLMGALLRNPSTQDLAERMFVLPWRGKEGEVGFLVFSRDPIMRETGGAARCTKAMTRPEQVKPEELPKLLAEQGFTEQGP